MGERFIERKIVVSGETIQDDEAAKIVLASLRRVHKLEAREVLEPATRIGLPVLKEFETEHDEYRAGLAEGSLQAILSDTETTSPAQNIRRERDEEGNYLIFFEDLAKEALTGNLGRIVGVGPGRKRFLEHFVTEVRGEDYYADLRDAMPGPKLD